ncbi:cytochrome b/b6 domain-containing protein [Aquidulcibacter paucihalophilus]|uniref:cytochrome b/b6 domain-containing protein n=1 Tax=Aquidulcibacter paucihalophilus TaxID=1978549 RepID=UPI000A19210C|nr:cytochrome b/b6 domain-containing protein [Aquidulcibacter paucihalophilus]
MTDRPAPVTEAACEPEATNPWVKVWDPLVRIGHWLLLVAIATALITRGEPETLHQAAGYFVAGYVVFRLFWGISGPTHARFENFLASPLAAIRYLTHLVTGKGTRHIGHSPPGGLMVIALLVVMSLTAGTGMAMENRTPVPTALESLLQGEARAGGDDDDSPWEEVHEASANLLLGLVFFHLGGVLLASFGHRENLVRAMVDGKKRAA